MNDTHTKSTNLNPGVLRKRLDQVGTRDFGRLLGRWLKLKRSRDGASSEKMEALSRDIEASISRAKARLASQPAVTLDESLPIAARGEDIIALLQKHQIVVIAGETGSGKTTQLPKLCLAAGRGARGLIGCTQPRRLAARSVARRVAEELGTRIGEQVGFQVRFTEQVGDDTRIKFMTDGILLAETQSDPWLSGYDTLIIDEAHERSLNIDFLLGYLKRLAVKRPDLKIIVTSATIDTKRFAEHFDGAPVIEVEGRTYPVEVRWRPVDHYAGDDSTRGMAQGSAEHIGRALDEISREDPRGDVLIFLPGEREIRDAHRLLERREYRDTEILPLYARLSAGDQDRVFRPGPKRRVVLATNVAETSLTVPRIRYVIDTGQARVKRYSQRSQIERLHVESVSQAAADQRKGRCGRVGPGICVRLYDEIDFVGRSRFTDPELLRSSLANVILRMLSLRLGEVEDFPFLDAPEPRAIGDGYRRLAELSAIDDKRRLTSIGHTLARLPIDVQLARMLVEANDKQVLAELITLVAFLSVQDPRERPTEARAAADAAHKAFVDPKSDFITILRLWEAYRQAHEELTQSKLRDWCGRHFLSFMRMREWRELHRQLLLVVRDLGWRTAKHEDAETLPAAGGGRKGRGREARGKGATPPQPSPASRGGSARGDAATATGGAGSPPPAGRGRQGEGRDVRGKGATPSQPSPASGGGRRHEGKAERSPRALAAAMRSASRGDTTARDDKRHSAQAASAVAEPLAADYELIHRSLMAGLPTQVGHKDEKGIFRGTRERKFQVFPGSGLAKSPPNWIFSAQILDVGGRVWGMLCARIEPAWIEQQAAHLLKRNCFDPHWARKRGHVVAFEQVSLFGLTLVERRPVNFHDQDPPLAHAIFLREALARCDIDLRADFVRGNAKVIAKAEGLEAKQRREGLLKGEEDLAAFYNGKLPPDMSSAKALDAWWRKASPAAQAALRWSLDDVLDVSPDLDAGAFPPALELDGVRYRLQYRFVPGDEADGVTLHLPLAMLNALPPRRCEWLVPGLLADKVAELIRGLPKSLRRNFVPAPDFARAFVEAEAARDEPLREVLAAFLKRATGVDIDAAAFADIDLPDHLRMRFRLHDDQGKTLAVSRDLEVLRSRYEDRAREAFSRKADAELIREDVHGWDFDEIPRKVRSEGRIDAYPALVDLGASVALRVFEREDEALAEHRRGVERLLRLALTSEFKRARRQLPIANALALKYTPLGTIDGLREDLAEGGFDDLLGEAELDVRKRADFEALRAELARALFGAAMARLEKLEPIIEAQAEMKPWLEPPLMGYATAAYDDLHEQLDGLLEPGFARTLSRDRLGHYPRYLRGMRLRAERLRQDAAKDQQRMLQVLPYWRAYLNHRAEDAGTPGDREMLRWLIEEWRVSLFAQELKTAEPVSPKRLARALKALEENA
ncbi:ATP-dependent RNA helicase HrpA [Oleiagrimonas sp. C23AA]|uniref:ATP-dependent RNA helicase HrpA n=1 Tax=Oleiagrimonas sp. C23AA TaxID=2719047 RepID=UPI00141ED880|nr:ATP-dependent RNA helicase HrpA [Oleiagrimonas sp. C23AA]NII10035.1 ATP-dependent RNA helicase HrpA [Oleiagrimonas sp. C23AA]